MLYLPTFTMQISPNVSKDNPVTNLASFCYLGEAQEKHHGTNFALQMPPMITHVFFVQVAFTTLRA